MERPTLVYPRLKYPAGDFSLGLAYITAYLKSKIKDTDADLIDTTFTPSFGYVASRLENKKSDIVGIYMGTVMYEDALKVAQIAKSHDAFVVVGGPHPSILPETVINHSCVDAVCIGEGEETFAELVHAYYDGRSFGNVDGIWYKENGKIVKNPRRRPIENLDILPFPDFEMFDVETYIQNFIQLDSYSPRLRGLSIIVSRGCPFRCSYCQPTLTRIFGNRFRIRSPSNVIDELKRLKERYTLDAFYFQDDTLTVSKDWALRFCKHAAEESLNMVWACNVRADTIDEELLVQMKQAGLVKVKVGIEAVSDRIRNGIYQKGISVQQINQLIEITRDLGIQTTGFFMLGAPTESEREIIQTIRYASGADLLEANFSVTVPLPETGLFEMARKQGWKLPERFVDYDYYHAVRPPMTSADVSSKRLQLYKQIAYLVFYLHPKRILHTIKAIWGIKGFRKARQKLKRF